VSTPLLCATHPGRRDPWLRTAPPLSEHPSPLCMCEVPLACRMRCVHSHGKAPPKDKKRRGEVRKAVTAADSAEKVQDMLLSKNMETFLLKMNWKKRHSMRVRIEKRAAQFDVEIPEGFASWNVKPRSARKHKLTPSL
jgi:hypothetical protein